VGIAFAWIGPWTAYGAIREVRFQYSQVHMGVRVTVTGYA
jgi:hypothetical protein